MPFTLDDLPLQPASVDEATSLHDLGHDDIARFAMTYDGYAHYGDHASTVLSARREEWERDGTLPRDVDAVRGLLFLAYRSERLVELDDVVTITDDEGAVIHAASPQTITPERRELERFKHALLARIRELVADRTGA